MKVWIDGGVVDGAEARVPVTDHGFLYGDGIFEGLRVHGRRLFRLDQHLARLASAARSTGLEIPGGTDDVRRIVLETCRAFDADDAYVRLIVSRGEGSLGVDPVDSVRIFPEEKRRAGLALVTSSLRRPPPDVLDPRVKSLNYLNNALAKQEARRQGADEALLLNAAGNVAEASVANVFALRAGELLTPPASDGALEGITRAAVLELAEGAGLPARVATLGRFDLFAAEEVFLTGTGAGIVPVRSLDGAPIGKGEPGEISGRLSDAYRRLVRASGTPIE
jgi:branched-chain amino acid aminotransferase